MEERAVCVLFPLISRKFNARCFLVTVAAEELPTVGRNFTGLRTPFLPLWRSKIVPGLMQIYALYDILRDILIYF
jgi:hypothetical protein